MSAEVHYLRGELACPRCGNNVLEVVGIRINFLCHDCWSCWHWNLGWLAHVSAQSCRTCSHNVECIRSREQRLSA